MGPSPFSAHGTGWAKYLLLLQGPSRLHFSPTHWPRPTPTSGTPSAVLVGSPLSEDDWRLASLGTSAGGNRRSLGSGTPLPRLTSQACPPRAALSTRICPAFDEYDLDSGCLRSDAEFELQSRVPVGAVTSDESLFSSQKALSSMIEARAFSDFMASDQVDVHRKAHLVLNRKPWRRCMAHFPSHHNTFSFIAPLLGGRQHECCNSCRMVINAIKQMWKVHKLRNPRWNPCTEDWLQAKVSRNVMPLWLRSNDSSSAYALRHAPKHLTEKKRVRRIVSTWPQRCFHKAQKSTTMLWASAFSARGPKDTFDGSAQDKSQCVGL